MYFIRWVDAGLLHAVRQVGLTGGIQQDAGWWSVEGNACEVEAVAVGSSETPPEAQLGIVESGASPIPCTPYEGPVWGGDTRRLCGCLEGKQKNSEGEEKAGGCWEARVG